MCISSITWTYLAEGNANIIVHNIAERKVLRIRKKEGAFDNTNKKTVNAFSVTSLNDFVMEVISPLFGYSVQYVEVLERIPVTSAFLTCLSEQIKLDRPSHRRHKEIDVNVIHVQMMPDVGFLPKSSSLEDKDVISVEIKPKWGFLPFSNKIKKAHCIKKSVCRFCMHQETKLLAGKIERKSRYCPLDLFSGCSCRVSVALKALFMDPQNNIRIRLNGKTVPVLYFDQKDHVACVRSTENLVKILVEIFKDDASFKKGENENLRYLVKEANFVCSNSKHANHADGCSTLQGNGILKYLKSFQMLDKLDIEGIFEIFTRLSKLDNAEEIFSQCMDFKSKTWKNTVSNILDGTTNHNEIEDLCRFLVSATMKDCSLVVTFQPSNVSDRRNDLGAVHFNGNLYSYLIKLIDLDPYFVQNIPWNHSLDHEIISNYLLQTVGEPCCAIDHM